MKPLPDHRIGSYRVLHPLGTGGMSSVFRAVHVESNHEVALKVLTRALGRNATLLQRFLREARSAETLEHPNIVAIYDRGVDSGRHYLVLEYVSGGDLHDHVQRHGPLSLVEAISVVRSVAAGLKYAATRGLIHRDIKPSNILRTPAGVIKIIDLGLALQNEFEDERVTREGTTVGTVDYMAPEQARDSRATSVQSDLYSLGCTFYYLLTGVAPFPGGDITEKLTRHAKTPPPEIRDLRPDLPGELSVILRKLMAKRPEDRFASYDDLLAALAGVPLVGGSEAPGVTFAPVSLPAGRDQPGYGYDIRPPRPSEESHSNGEAKGTIPLGSLAELVASEDDEFDQGFQGELAPERPLVNRGAADQSEDSPLLLRQLPRVETGSPPKPAIRASAWIIPGACVCAALVILGIGISQFMGSHGGPNADLPPGDGDAVAMPPVEQPFVPARATAATDTATATGRRFSNDDRIKPAVAIVTKPPLPQMKWVEPEDADPPEYKSREPVLPASIAARFLPDWARNAVPDRVEGPFVVVRRVTDENDPSVVSALHRALDGFIGGTVELADEGPLSVDDLRVAGETRLIRARKGFRPIVRIERQAREAVRKQAAVFVLNRKNLTLEGIDFIVDVRELSRTQTALFLCTGANLTLRNCSITILNQSSITPITLIRTGTEGAGSRPTHVRIEGCLVRGALSEGFRITGGRSEVVLRDSVVLAGNGPLVRFEGADAALESRVFVVQSLVAGPGPVFDWTKKTAGAPGKPIVIRAFASVFGRLHGAGIASVIASSDAGQPAGKQVDWAGEDNLFAGWKGFFACGEDQTVTVNDLAEARSTWNGTDTRSHEILPDWPHRADLAQASPEEFSSFVPSHQAVLRRAVRPRSGLFEKAVGAYGDPVIPDPAGWVFESVALAPAPRPASDRLLPAHMTEMGTTGFRPANGSNTEIEFVFNTESQPWRGDLGGFLRDRLTPGLTLARVRVQGSGPHRFSPVKLPPGIRLEIRIEPVSGAEPPTWSPQEGATGTALIELQGGALVVSKLILRHEQSARLDHLIHVEDGDLVLSQCQLTAPVGSSDFTGNLIAFRSASTRPRPRNGDRPLFSIPIDRPVCRMIDCVLITGGRAVSAELGRGLVALTQCAVSAGTTAIELVPAKVARHRFEADLYLDYCTLTSERAIVRMGPWLGLAPGPDRPWLITSRNCAFLAVSGRPVRETLLLRCDGDALASGTIFWQASGDAADVDWFINVGDGPPPNHARDVQIQWVGFWGRTHMGRVFGPRGAGSPPSVRFRERLRAGQAVEPSHLILDPSYHPDRPELAVGADLSRQGIYPSAAPVRQVQPPS
jgi:serine/threonine-protein kinase